MLATSSLKILTRIVSLPQSEGELAIHMIDVYASLLRDKLCRSDGKWIQFTGDQLGTLFANAALHRYKASRKPLGTRVVFGLGHVSSLK